ncbi:hypothetical protein L810_7914 [Burkholderia sp. AU4i]|nr:hypothetical protein L810_7914 [Burkholderia sp. AU4i]
MTQVPFDLLNGQPDPLAWSVLVVGLDCPQGMLLRFSRPYPLP